MLPLLAFLIPVFQAPRSAPACAATPSSLTPAGWSVPAMPPRPAPSATQQSLKLVKDVPLPGSPSRFDYQSIDPAAGRLYISHMGAGHLVVFNLDSSRVIGDVPEVG